MLPQQSISKFQAFVYFNFVIWTIHLVSLLTAVGHFIKDNSMYTDTQFRETYIASLVLRFIWIFPIIFVLNSLKNYYGILVNKGCCDSSIETVILTYILLNTIPNILIDFMNLGESRLYDIEIYKVQGPLTICLMLAPIIFGLLTIIAMIYIERCYRWCYQKNGYHAINDEF